MQVIIDTTSAIKYGHSCLHIFPVSGVNGVVLPRIIVALSMLYFGFYAPAHRGVTFLRTMENGALCISDLFVGGEKESGENCWIF